MLEQVELTLKPSPVETARAAIERDAQLAPDDDRVWLARANLALRTGAHDEAEKWLDKCQKLRPDDGPVWHARLRLGMATGQTDVVTLAMNHSPKPELTAAELHRTKAWLAAHRGDDAAERHELELLLASEPADESALDRLAVLAEKHGEPTRAAELGRIKAELARLLARYLKLHERNQPIRDAEELAGLAEALGRRFEARGFLTIATSEDPARADLRQRLRQLSAAPAP